MGDENILEYLHFELVNYCINGVGEKKEVDSTQNQASKISKLEYVGFNTGYRLIEKMTKEMPRFKDELDTVKFICTDFWSSVFKKQVDNLRTNHQGIYVLQDNTFRFLKQISSTSQYLDQAPCHVVYTCGLIRGTLANLGINSIVTAEITGTMPSCKFHIQVKH